MLKFENVAQVGDLIKAFDFEPCPGRPDRFVVGVVVAKGAVTIPFSYDAYTIKCVYDSWDMTVGKKQNKFSRVGQEVVVPFECSLLEYDTRITKV
jgi:hypothetical protein